MNELNLMQKWGLFYSSHDLAVLRLYRIKNGSCTCHAGKKCPHKQGKHPSTEHGVKDATDDKALILEWFKAEMWNIGLACGEKGNLTVLDVDPKNGGLESLKELRKFPGNWEDTLLISTGSKGYHYYYEYSSEVKQRRNVLPGIDIINEGGYVVAPPSNHLSGNYYSFFYSQLRLLSKVRHLRHV